MREREKLIFDHSASRIRLEQDSTLGLGLELSVAVASWKRQTPARVCLLLPDLFALCSKRSLIASMLVYMCVYVCSSFTNMIIHHAESTQRKHGMTAAFSERKFLKEQLREREREKLDSPSSHLVREADGADHATTHTYTHTHTLIHIALPCLDVTMMLIWPLSFIPKLYSRS